jgi:hypothetical protein
MKLVSLTIALLCGLITQRASAYDREVLGNWYHGLNPDKVVLAINCGSTDGMVDALGVEY